MELNDHFSSKIKKVLIELHNYDFFHSPSEINNLDPRFIGRSKIIERIKAIFSFSATKSGAYLVAGYRGIGKSSFISKALYENITSFKLNLQTKVYFILFLITLLFSHLFFSLYNDYSSIFCIIPILLLSGLVFTSRKTKSSKNSITVLISYFTRIRRAQNLVEFPNDENGVRVFQQLKVLILYFIEMFYLCDTKTNKRPLLLIFKSILLINLAILFSFFFNIAFAFLSILIILLVSNPKTSVRAYMLFGLYESFLILLIKFFPVPPSNSAICYLVFFSFFYIFGELFSFYKRHNSLRILAFRELWKMFISGLISKIKFVKPVTIKINIGTGAFKEMEVFRLIAAYLLKNYKDFTKFSARNWLRKTLTVIVLYFALVFLNSYFINYFTSSRFFTGLNYYFPSQISIGSLSAVQDYNRLFDKYISGNNLPRHNEFIYNMLYKYKFHIINKNPFIKTDIYRSENFVRNSSIYADYAFFNIHNYIFYYPNRAFSWIISSQRTSHKHLRSGPIQYDILILFQFIMILLAIRILKNFSFFNLTTHHIIYKKLVHLNELINAQISLSKNIDMNKEGFGFGIAKTKKYEILKGRDIERYLIDIFDEIENLFWLLGKPQFIFIFDELDKILPNDDFIENSENLDSRPIEFTPANIRERQKMLIKLFSNMKYFLSTAKAKFIFIGGREIYDAALADTSDRNFIIGSIFNDIIYVPSFLTDSDKSPTGDITKLTEEYVCKLIIPDDFQPILRDRFNSINLSAFNAYITSYKEFENRTKTSLNPDYHSKVKEYQELLKTVLELETDIQKAILFDKSHFYKTIDLKCKKLKLTLLKKCIGSSKDVIARQKQEKLIFTIHHLIVYLTHRSNGAPKKIVSLLEDYIQPYSSKYNDSNSLILGKNNKNLYLCIGYFEQYNIGFTHYLAEPIFLSINNNLRRISDKLLVSSSFVLDHLFKFHRFAFSWRNIELTPEIIDVNKDPELRNFIAQMISFLSLVHLDEITSGLYQFKFPRFISEEIIYLTKSSEKASAAFNFSLDELQATKKYFQSISAKLENRYEKTSDFNSTNYIHSKSLVHMILGDLHFYDEEYNEAIIEYKEAAQALRSLKDVTGNASLLLLLIRNMLKLGVAFERRKTFNTAYLIYNELCDIIIKYRDIDLSEYNLKEVKLKDNEIGFKYVLSRPSDAPRELCSPLTPFDHNKTHKSEELLKPELETFTARKNELFMKLGAIENLSMFVHPFIASLQIIEKSSVSGITKVDVERVICQFDFLTRLFDKHNKFLIISEFYKKIADVLFFKNACFTDYSRTNIESEFYCSTCIQNSNPDYKNHKPCTACHYYNKSLVYLLNHSIVNTSNNHSDISRMSTKQDDTIVYYDYKSHLINLSQSLKHDSFKNHSAVYFVSMAKILSDLGDVYLSCTEKSDIQISMLVFRKFLCFFKKNKSETQSQYNFQFNFLNDSNTRITKYESVLFYYYYAGIFYKKANKYKDFVYIQTKLLTFLREYLINNNCSQDANNLTAQRMIDSSIESDNKNFINCINEYIVKNALKSNYFAYESVHRAEIIKFHHIFKNTNTNSLSRKMISLNRLSFSHEIKRFLNIYLEIEILSLSGDEKIRKLAEYYNNPLINGYSTNNSVYGRINDLIFKTFLNKQVIDLLGLNDTIKTPMNHVLDHNNQTSFEIRMGNFMNSLNEPYESNFNKFISELRYSEYPDKHELIKTIICDSIFCLNEILKISNMHGISFLLDHSFVASVHRRLMNWMLYFNGFSKWEKTVQHKRDYHPIEESINSLLNEDLLSTVTPHFQTVKSIKRYYGAVECHTGGKAYKQLIEKMYFYNEDYNDNIYHFHAALERYKLNTGRIKAILKNLQEIDNYSKIYNPEEFMGTTIPD